MMKRVRRGQLETPRFGFIVTWDVDCSDRSTGERLRRFVFGSTVISEGRVYRYPGFIVKEGVRYLGQSVVFVPFSLLTPIESKLSSMGIDHETIRAVLG